MGRYTIGRRRYSWEKRARSRRAYSSPGSDSAAGIIVVLVLTYFFAPPIFWCFIALIVFIALCLLVAGVCKLVQWNVRRRPLFRRRR